MKITVIDRLVYGIMHIPVKKLFHKKLSGRLPEGTVSKLPGEIWNEYKNRLPGLEKKETAGATLVIRLSLLTLILYEKLIAENIQKQEAIRLTSEITWAVYDKLTGIFWFFTRFFSGKPIVRLRKAMNFAVKYFPYNSPGYEMEFLKTDDREFFFDVHKCPSADFFIEHRVSELCSETWCNLDYSLAEKWNVGLEREKTIAKGDGICTFRFKAKSDANLHNTFN